MFMDKRSRIREKVYRIARKIPKGRVTTYGALAKKARTSARAIGQIMKNHKTDIPCHRVVMFNGHVGGYRGKHYQEKIEKLRKEGIIIKKKKIIDFNSVLLRYLVNE
jgi:O-6-methylguanine DNA methyltransferase